MDLSQESDLPYIPPDLTGPDITFMYQNLDAQLNTGILYAHLHGIYTGIVVVSLWNIFTCKSRPIGRKIMFVAIILLFGVSTITVGFNWSYVNSIFIDNGQSFWSRFSVLAFSPSIFLGMGVTSAISSILADSTMIWRCWMVWGRRWPVVLPPILMLISGIVFKLIYTYQQYTIAGSDYVLGFTLYLSLILATTIWCTALIIYRILTVGRASDGIGGGVGVYRHVIEVLIESSTLYSVFLILLVAFEVRGDIAVAYVDAMSGIMKGIAPTLLAGRVAVGHGRSDETWQSSVMSSLHFGTWRSRNSDQSSFEEETLVQNSMPELEAQRGVGDGRAQAHEHWIPEIAPTKQRHASK